MSRRFCAIPISGPFLLHVATPRALLVSLQATGVLMSDIGLTAMRRILIGLLLILFAFPAASQSKKHVGNTDKFISPETNISQETLDLLKVDFLGRGNAAFNKGHFREAIADYTKAIMQLSVRADAADIAEIYTNRGNAYYRRGRYDKAIADETKAIALSPRTASGAYNMRAWIRLLKGENAKALVDANKAVELAPTDANNLETRAEIFEKLGQREKAIADYRASLKQNPSNKNSQAALKRLGVP